MAFHNPFLKDGQIRFPDNGSLVRHVERWAKVRGDKVAYRFLDFSTERDGVERDLNWADFSTRNRAVGARLQQVTEPGDRIAILCPQNLDYLVGYGVDGDDARTLLGGTAAEKLAHTLGRFSGGQNGRRLAVVEDGVQSADVARLAGVEQRNGDAARVQGAVERDQVVEVLRAQNGDAITRLGDLLQAGTHRAVAGTELSPRHVPFDTVAFGRVVQESVGELVATHRRPSLDVTNQAAVIGKPDLSVLADERVMERHLTLLSDHTCPGGQSPQVPTDRRSLSADPRTPNLRDRTGALAFIAGSWDGHPFTRVGMSLTRPFRLADAYHS